tara:strand:+ start:78 stop:800 length:723 start_codon:yes stop_codon:yes gene_type:complete
MKKISEVYTTKNYESFSFLGNNRMVSKAHVNKLIDSMRSDWLMSPILVNEHRQIIDGQHRFLAQQELQLSVPFIVKKGYGEKETQILNTNTKNWSLSDWERYYCEKNIKDYHIFREFRKKYKFNFDQTEYLLTQKMNSGPSMKIFKDGLFLVKSLSWAVETSEKLLSVEIYFKDYKGRDFVRAMVHCFKNPEYSHKKFLKKLSYQGNSLVKCVDKKSYLRLVESIYNFRSTYKTKSLRLF